MFVLREAMQEILQPLMGFGITSVIVQKEQRRAY